MADFHLVCPVCATENVFSEYSEVSARFCKSCGIAFSPPVTDPAVPTRTPAPELQIQARSSRRPPPLPLDVAGTAVPTAGRAATALNVRREGGRSRWVALLSFLFFSALFVGPQPFLDRFPQEAQIYLIGRFGAVALGLLLILAEAFREGVSQGALCLLAPFYVVYYGLTRVESYWRQGYTLAVLALLIAELHFLPDHAMLTLLSDWMSGRVAAVGNLIQRAGDAPIQ